MGIRRVACLVLAMVCAGGVLPATAGTGTVRWACSSEGAAGPTALELGLDTGLPGVLHVGEPAEVTTTLAAALPAATAKRTYDGAAIKARSVEASFTLQGMIGTQPVEQSLLLTSTPIPDQSTATAVPFESVTTPMTYVPSAPGDAVVTTSTLDVTWTFRRGDGSVAASIRSVCRPDSGAPVVVDSAVVRSRSMTSVALDAPSSVYGQTVVATAAVSTTAGPVPGGVAFSVDGVAYRAPLEADGSAFLALPRAPVGTHRVSATFLAIDPGHHDTSTSTNQVWTVARAETAIRVAVHGRHVRRSTRVALRLSGSYDTVPTGRVKVTLRKLTPRRSRRKVGAPVSQGQVRADLGRLAHGKYRLIVVYRGDAAHLPARKTKTFRVR